MRIFCEPGGLGRIPDLPRTQFLGRFAAGKGRARPPLGLSLNDEHFKPPQNAILRRSASCLSSQSRASPLWQSRVLIHFRQPGHVPPNTIYMLTASALLPAMRRRGKFAPVRPVQTLTAAAFIGLGVYARSASPARGQ